MMTVAEKDDDVRHAVEQVIELQIRPFLRIHGGDITLVDVRAGHVQLEFQGACRACALKAVTYAIGVRERMRRLPGVHNVALTGVSLSAQALDRVARAYAAHPLGPMTVADATPRA